MYRQHYGFSVAFFAGVAASLLFMAQWSWSVTQRLSYFSPTPSLWWSIALQYVCIIALYFIVPASFVSILTTVWACQLPFMMSVRNAILSSAFWSLPLHLVYGYYWHFDDTLQIASLYWMFNLFALVTMNTVINERRARQQVSELNRDLVATQALLAQATAQSERLRIARDVHDVLGHHLTALSIHLQVASRQANGDAKASIDQCLQLSKLLLSDVRHSVSEIREQPALELKPTLEKMIEQIPHLTVALDYDEGIEITSTKVCEVILRCVQESLTNTLKHSNATQFSIVLQRDNGLVITLSDNGHGEVFNQLGNGLTGMQERVEALDGELSFSHTTTGFSTRIRLNHD